VSIKQVALTPIFNIPLALTITTPLPAQPGQITALIALALLDAVGVRVGSAQVVLPAIVPKP